MALWSPWFRLLQRQPTPKPLFDDDDDDFFNLLPLEELPNGEKPFSHREVLEDSQQPSASSTPVKGLFYETSFRPEAFRINLHPQIFDKFIFQKTADVHL
jgi:hypothetical protein